MGRKATDIARQNEYYASATIGYDLGWGWTTALAEDFSIGDLRTNVVSQPNPYPLLIADRLVAEMEMAEMAGGWESCRNLHFRKGFKRG